MKQEGVYRIKVVEKPDGSKYWVAQVDLVKLCNSGSCSEDWRGLLSYTKGADITMGDNEGGSKQDSLEIARSVIDLFKAQVISGNANKDKISYIPIE